MVQLLGHIAAVVATILLLHALLAGMGARLPLRRVAALGAALVLVLTAVASYRDNWHNQRIERSKWLELPASEALAECAGSTGADGAWIAFLKGRIEENERFYIAPGEKRGQAPDICLRMLMLPRTQEDREQDARHVLLIEDFDRGLVREYAARGARVQPYDRTRVLVTLP